MDEQTIKKIYTESPNENVKLLCSHTTREEGFLDILLSGSLLSSEEAGRLLGYVKTHRGSSMSQDRRETCFTTNDDISFSTGFVSFKYSNASIRTRKDYIGGKGILVPLEKILEHPRLGFSHCSDKGGIKNYKLNKQNIVEAVHKTRKAGELYDDGYGNIFEVGIKSELEPGKSMFRRVISYPRLKLTDEVVVAIPKNEREKIKEDIGKRQKEYKKFLEKIPSKDPEKLRWMHIDGRDLYSVEELIPFIEKMTKPFDINNLPINWYEDKNLDIALQRIAISQ